jgi:Fic family protein
MYDNPAQMEPLMPSQTGVLSDMATEVLQKSAALGGGLHPITSRAVVGLLRIINSYYSNLIEGNSTHPVDIERAMQGDYEVDVTKRALQLESRAHISVQDTLFRTLSDEPHENVVDVEFILKLHYGFYELLPEDLRLIDDPVAPPSGGKLEIIPGALRERDVEVGRHLAPKHQAIRQFLQRFSQFYDPARFHGDTKLVAAAAAHHRLAWIHPFLDGNGRVTRLFTDAYLTRIGVDGYGLWNVSRGLARSKSEYMKFLAVADSHRKGDLDGRGNLSNKGLIEFCEYFLATCTDQIAFMQKLLQLDGMRERLNGYVELRNAKMIPGPSPEHKGLNREASYLLQEAFTRGEFARGEAKRISGVSERMARSILKQLTDEGLLVSDTPKGAVRLGIPVTVASYWLPMLYPEQIIAK